MNKIWAINWQPVVVLIHVLYQTWIQHVFHIPSCGNFVTEVFITSPKEILTKWVPVFITDVNAFNTKLPGQVTTNKQLQKMLKLSLYM